ncbi:hypothetical protein ACA910_005170 [Epithemia clementina (nom. ined.)]
MGLDREGNLLSVLLEGMEKGKTSKDAKTISTEHGHSLSKKTTCLHMSFGAQSNSKRGSTGGSTAALMRPRAPAEKEKPSAWSIPPPLTTVDAPVLSSSLSCTQKKSAPPAKRYMPYKKGRTKKPNDAPRRALSAYNFFFAEQRNLIVEERTQQLRAENADSSQFNSKTKKAKISFEELAKIIGVRWKNISPRELAHYKIMAEEDIVRFKNEMDAYTTKQEHATTLSSDLRHEQNKSYPKKCSDDDDDKTLTSDYVSPLRFEQRRLPSRPVSVPPRLLPPAVFGCEEEGQRRTSSASYPGSSSETSPPLMSSTSRAPAGYDSGQQPHHNVNNNYTGDHHREHIIVRPDPFYLSINLKPPAGALARSVPENTQVVSFDHHHNQQQKRQGQGGFFQSFGATSAFRPPSTQPTRIEQHGRQQNNLPQSHCFSPFSPFDDLDSRVPSSRHAASMGTDDDHGCFRSFNFPLSLSSTLCQQQPQLVAETGLKKQEPDSMAQHQVENHQEGAQHQAWGTFFDDDCEPLAAFPTYQELSRATRPFLENQQQPRHASKIGASVNIAVTSQGVVSSLHQATNLFGYTTGNGSVLGASCPLSQAEEQSNLRDLMSAAPSPSYYPTHEQEHNPTLLEHLLHSAHSCHQPDHRYDEEDESSHSNSLATFISREDTKDLVVHSRAVVEDHHLPSWMEPLPLAPAATTREQGSIAEEQQEHNTSGSAYQPISFPIIPSFLHDEMPKPKQSG